MSSTWHILVCIISSSRNIQYSFNSEHIAALKPPQISYLNAFVVRFQYTASGIFLSMICPFQSLSSAVTVFCVSFLHVCIIIVANTSPHYAYLDLSATAPTDRWRLIQIQQKTKGSDLYSSVCRLTFFAAVIWASNYTRRAREASLSFHATAACARLRCAYVLLYLLGADQF